MSSKGQWNGFPYQFKEATVIVVGAGLRVGGVIQDRYEDLMSQALKTEERLSQKSNDLEFHKI